MKVKKRLTLPFMVSALFMALTIFSAVNVPQAHAASVAVATHNQIHGQFSVKPNASGGGCWESINYGNYPYEAGLFDIRACISYDGALFDPGVIPNSYITFGFAQPYLWTDCSVTTYHYKNGNYTGLDRAGCLSTARSNGSTQIGPYSIIYPGGGSYSEAVCVEGTFNGYAEYACQMSPTLYV